MEDQIIKIEQEFAYCGFTETPLTRRHIISLLVRGFDEDKIYSIGCDVGSGIYSTYRK